MDEPSLLLRAATYHFASGQAWWIGLALLLLAVRTRARGWTPGKVTLIALLGLLWVALSGWPSYVMQGLLFAVVIGWFMRPALPAQASLPNATRFGQGVIAVIAFAILSELPWLLGPWQAPALIKELAVLGDSVTAGLNAEDVTWPRILAESGSCTIWDASQQGATVKSASQQLARLDRRGDALVIEIGGNDLLEGVPLEQFTAGLETLLQSARRQYSTIVMLELPLPPFSNRYGMAQRQLAWRCGIPLIPKREFADVLTAAGSTVDGIHLSDRGQQRMADVVRYWLGLRAASRIDAEYHRVDVR
jgi:acyl-CoA thioesterase I